MNKPAPPSSVQRVGSNDMAAAVAPQVPPHAASLKRPSKEAIGQVRRAVFPDGLTPAVGAPKRLPAKSQRKAASDNSSSAFGRPKDVGPGRIGRLVRRIFYLLIFGSGFVALRRWRLRRPGRCPVAILMYHRVNDLSHDLLTVSVDRFIQQMLFIRRHYRVISLGRLVHYAHRGERPPCGAVAITFDDGYADNARIAAPILSRLGLPACFFVSARHIDHGLAFAHDDTSPFRFENMTWDEARGLLAIGMEVGSHGLNHCDLGHVGLQRACREIVGSKQMIEKALGREVIHFAFPFGKEKHAPRVALLAVERARYRSASTACGAINVEGINPFNLERIGITEDHDRLRLRAEIEGLSLQVIRGAFRRRRQGAVSARSHVAEPAGEAAGPAVR